MDRLKGTGPPKLRDFSCEKSSDDCFKMNFEVDDYKSENGLKKYRIEMDSSNLDAVLNEFYKIKSIYVETHKKKDS